MPDAVLFDLDGVLYRGDEPIPGGAEAVDWLRQHQVPHLFLTNTTSKPRAALAEKLSAMEIACEAERILTPPVAARSWLAKHAPGPVALFVPDATRGDFEGLAVLDDAAEQGASAVVVGDLGDGWSFAVLNRAFRLLMVEPQPALVALGRTRYWRAPDGLRLDVGAFAAALETASGARAEVLGKPALAFFEAALATLGCDAGRAIMIGDDIVGDIQGAQRAGVQGVLVRTGKFRASDLEGEIHPDAVLPSVAALPEWWQAQA